MLKNVPFQVKILAVVTFVMIGVAIFGSYWDETKKARELTRQQQYFENAYPTGMITPSEKKNTISTGTKMPRDVSFTVEFLNNDAAKLAERYKFAEDRKISGIKLTLNKGQGKLKVCVVDNCVLTKEITEQNTQTVDLKLTDPVIFKADVEYMITLEPENSRTKIEVGYANIDTDPRGTMLVWEAGADGWKEKSGFDLQMTLF